MKNGLIATFALLITLMALSFCFADGVVNPVLNIRTIDGNTDTYPYQLKVSNGSLTDNGDGTATLSSGLNWDDPTVIQNVNDISGWTIATDSVYLTDTSKFVDVDSDVYAENINYNEGMLSDPTISDATGTAISITSADCLIRSDATWDNGRLIRKTVPENLELVVTDNSTNYIYVSYNSGSPIYAATTDRDVLNNSDALPVARVYTSGGNIEYQLSYQYLGRSAAIRNFDRVMRIRGRFGIEPESGLGLSESGTRVVNVGSGFAWFGLSRKTLNAVVQGGVGVTSHIWYHSSGGWVEAAATNYNNTQYDNGTDLVTLTAGRYAVNWVFRNLVGNEIDIVLGSGDYTLAQAEASTLPALPEQISNFYVLCGRIIVRKSENAAYAIENVSTSIFNQAAVTIHNDLSSLQGGTAGEYYHLTSAQSTALTTPIASSSINWDNVNISKPILMGGINWQDATIAPAVDGVNVWNVADKDANAILSVDSTNNRVGIGIVAPTSKLHVRTDAITGNVFRVDDNIASTSAYLAETGNTETQNIGDISNNEYRYAQKIILYESKIVSSVDLVFASSSGSPSGQFTVRIETNGGTNLPSGTLVDANFTSAITPTQNSSNKFSFTPTSLSAGTYWIVCSVPNQSTNVYWGLRGKSPKNYTDGEMVYSTNGTWATYGGGTHNLTFNLNTDGYNHTAPLVFTYDGKLGVGNTAPTTTFDVTGTGKFSSTLTYPTPFTLGATSVTTTGTQLNYLNAATGTTGTASSNLMFSASPTVTGTFTYSATADVYSQISSGAYIVTRTADTNPALQTFISASGTRETNPKYVVSISGKNSWGAGGGSVVDTNLYRGAADLLQTDDVFQAGGYKSSDGTAGVTVTT